MRMAAIYARVSSEQQREANTIASQTASLLEFAQGHDLEVPKEWVFEDDGYSGATLERPGLERVRDPAAVGVSRLLCKRPGFVFGDGVPGKGAVSLPRPISVETGRAFIVEFSPGPASVPATES
jgi:Resolvase, N terminal domain